RRVGIFVRQTESEEHAGYLESVMHLSNERNRSTLADEDGLFAETRLQSVNSLLKNRMRIGRNPRFAGAEHFEFMFHGFWQQLGDVAFDELGNFRGILIGNQTRREFSGCFRGNYRLRTFSNISAPDSIDFERRPRPKAFDDGKALFSAESRRADSLAEFCFFPG